MDDQPRCKAKAKLTGERCRNRPMLGQTVCRLHGGSTQRARHAGARRVAQAEAAKQLERLGTRGPLEDPVAELLTALRELVDLKDLLRQQLKEAEDADDARVDAYARALERVQRALTDAARLDLEARLVRIEESKVQAVTTALRGVVRDLGFDPDEPQVREVVRRRFTRLDSRPDDQPTLAGSPQLTRDERVRARVMEELGTGGATWVTVVDVEDAIKRAQADA